MSAIGFSSVPSTPQALSFTANLAQAAATYDLCTASGGDILLDISRLAIYVATAGATLTSVSIQSNQTNITTILSAVEGAVANLIAQKNLVRVIPVIGGLLLKSGQKLQYTIVGATGTGSLNVAIPFMSLTAGATLI
jgi:anti-anti-sigma regulatory factor